MIIATIRHKRVINGRSFIQVHNITQNETPSGHRFYFGMVQYPKTEVHGYTGDTLSAAIVSGMAVCDYRDVADRELTECIAASNAEG